MINAFYDRVEQDDLLSPFFPGGVHEEHRVNVATWWSEVFGGPADYTDQLGGYERMLHKHLQLGITDEQRFRFASLMSLAADDAGLPDDPEFRSALVAYLEWGTRLALGNSAVDAEVVAHAPVPRWGWGEAPPSLACERSPYEVVKPPSTEKAAPVTPLASGAHSHAMRAAGSSGSNRRSINCWWANSSAESSP